MQKLKKINVGSITRSCPYSMNLTQAYWAEKFLITPRTSVGPFVCLFVLLLYVPSQQLWSLRDGQFT